MNQFKKFELEVNLNHNIYKVAMSNGKILPSSTFIMHTHTQDHKKSLPEFSLLLSCHRKIAEKYFQSQTISHLGVPDLKELIKRTYSQYFNIVLIKNAEKYFDSIPLMVPAVVFEHTLICF